MVRAAVNMPSLVAALRRGDKGMLEAHHAGPPQVQGLGPVSAAAWLAWSQRKELRRTGAMQFMIPHGVPAPRWFLVGWEVLKQRPKWRCVVLHQAVIGGKLVKQTIYRAFLGKLEKAS